MRKPFSVLRIRWIRRALYSGAITAVLVGTWLVEEELCRTSNTVRTGCGAVPGALYWIGAGLALWLAGLAVFSLWFEGPESDS